MSTDRMNSRTNAALFERAQKVIPGGVNSPVRAFRAVGGTPRFIARAQGPYIYDAEGTRYIDYIGSWGPMILGHGHPAVLEAVQKAAVDGFSFGAPTEREVELAEEILASLEGRLAKMKWPRTVDFIETMPREPNGKLLKRKLRDPYWKDRDSAI